MAREQVTKRMRQWIEKRILDAGEKRMWISTKDLVGEVKGMIRRGTPSEKFERDLKTEIERTRFRLRKQIQDWIDARKKMADELHIPEETIDDWKRRGFFKPCTPEIMEGITMSVKEYVYYKTHGLTVEDIPKDHSQPLWDDESEWDEKL